MYPMFVFDISNILFLTKHISCSDSDRFIKDDTVSQSSNNDDYTNSSNSDLYVCDDRTCYEINNCIESGLEKCETKVTNMNGRRRTNELNKENNTDRFWYQKDIDAILCKLCNKQSGCCVCNKYKQSVFSLNIKENGTIYVPKKQKICINDELNVKVVKKMTSINQEKYESIDEILEQDKKLFYAAYVKIATSRNGPKIYLIKKIH